MTDFSSSGCFSVAMFRCFSSCDLVNTLSIILVVGESVCLRPSGRTVAFALKGDCQSSSTSSYIIINKEKMKEERTRKGRGTQGSSMGVLHAGCNEVFLV